MLHTSCIDGTRLHAIADTWAYTITDDLPNCRSASTTPQRPTHRGHYPKSPGRDAPQPWALTTAGATAGGPGNIMSAGAGGSEVLSAARAAASAPVSPAPGAPGAQGQAHIPGSAWDLLTRPTWSGPVLPYSDDQVMRLEASLLRWLLEMGAINRQLAAQVGRGCV